MNHADIVPVRLYSQQLLGTKFHSPMEITHWMAAIQAQDFAMAKWAIGARLADTHEQDVNQALDDGEILRTHLVRPTWHFVTPQDIGWLIDLTAEQIRNAMRSRDRVLELDEPIYTRSNLVIEKALNDGKYLTREELTAALARENIATDQNRASHLFMRAELEKIMCSGRMRNGKVTYALLPERVKHPRKLTRDEALAELARRYFTGRCPATQKDFAWWSGLPAGDVRRAIELVKESFQAEQIAGQTYWLPTDFSFDSPHRPKAHLLPPYDEYLISYQDRSAAIPVALEQYMKAISDRGLFRPVVALDGQIIGTWKRSIKKSDIQLDIQLFKEMGKSTRELIESTSADYSAFMQKDIISRFI